ncbi:hypothetical protein ACJMK2_010021 [Sinanodonta woodiana]|uniref:Uncharacterized protein n=1 Tax=Sinanodonta woodiana TaxID=1069815 RepID=A0ABD3VE21_SINWO
MARRNRNRKMLQFCLEKKVNWKRNIYVPTTMLKPAQLKVRRSEILQRVNKHYQKKNQKDSTHIPSDSNTANSPADVMVELRHKNQNLVTANKILQKRIERIRKQQARKEIESSDTEKESELTMMTPRSKTKNEMKNLELNRLLLENTKVRRTLIESRRKFLLTNTKKKKTLSSGVQWKGLVRKYRCGSKLSKSMGVRRQKVAKLCVQRKSSTKNTNLR